MSGRRVDPTPRSPAARRTHDGPPVHLLVALPSSGRTTWLAERAEAAARTLRAGSRPVWVRGDRGSAAPPGVDDIEVEELLERPVGDLAGCAIAIDDLHRLPDAVLERLAVHLDAAIESGAMVAATSIAVLPTPMDRWAGRWPVRWLGQEALRTDLRAYLDGLIPHGILGHDAKRLHRELDGWAGPLAAAALHAPGPPGALTHEDLFREAVDHAGRALGPIIDALRPVPPALSLLPTVSRSLLQAVVEPAEAAAAEAALRRLVPPVGGPEAASSLHPVLRQLLGRAAPPGPEASALRERAQAWYFAHDHYTDGILLVIEDGRPDEALALIHQHLPLLPLEGRTKQRMLMDQLPRFNWTGADWALFGVACVADGDHRQSAVVLRNPTMMAPDLPPELVAAREMCAAALGIFGQPPEPSIAAARVVLRVLDELPAGTQLPYVLVASQAEQYRAMAINYIGRAQIVLGEWDEALTTLRVGWPSGHPMVDHIWVNFRTWLHGLRGDVDDATSFGTRAIASSEFFPEMHPLVAEARLGLAEIEVQRGRFDDALRLATEALNGGTAQRSEHLMACAFVAIAETQLRSGRPGEARDALGRITDGAHGFVGRRARAIQARALMADGVPERAAALLERLPLDQHTIVAHADAIAHEVTTPVSADAIEAWEPPPWPSGHQARDEAWGLLVPGAGGGSVVPSPARPTPGRLAAVDRVAADHDLSNREAEILAALLTGAPLNDVADELYISRNTLKTHLRRVYQKLDVAGRAGAMDLVARAERQGR